jgi:hypothetical protein
MNISYVTNTIPVTNIINCNGILSYGIYASPAYQSNSFTIGNRNRISSKYIPVELIILSQIINTNDRIIFLVKLDILQRVRNSSTFLLTYDISSKIGQGKSSNANITIQFIDNRTLKLQFVTSDFIIDSTLCKIN